MAKSEFIKAVQNEVKALRKNATSSELNNLNFDIDPPIKTHCLYGQLTKHCESDRAKELMGLCCGNQLYNDNGTATIESITEAEKLTIEEYDRSTWEESLVIARDYKYLSVLEAYILCKDSKIEHVVKYLKGQIKNLNL